MELLSEGKWLHEIAEEMGITHGTARNMLETCLNKLQAVNRPNAVYKFCLLGGVKRYGGTMNSG